MSRSFIQPRLEPLAGYVPGEQPRSGGLVKLNTNENPYPPSPRVFQAIAAALDGRLRLYPDPMGTSFREVAARLHGVTPGMILPGNGSDDLLTILTRACVGEGERIAYPTPSYILYRTLCDLQGAQAVEISFGPGWRLEPAQFEALDAKLAFLANPNSPSGTCLRPDEVESIAARFEGLLVVDEAYADFGQSHCIDLVGRCPNVAVLRTLSKGYSLAGLRLGYLVGREELVRDLVKVKDSYNCDSLSLVGGAAALEDQDYLAETAGMIRRTRERLQAAASAFGYESPTSQANFVWCPAGADAARVYRELKERAILVRLMRYAGQPDGIRITVGTDEQIDRLIVAWREVLKGVSARDA